MTTDESLEEVLSKIEEVWGEYEDFENHGLKYAAFVIGTDLQEMEDENWDETEVIEEFSDICINSLRIIKSHQGEPIEQILKRLDDHREKDLEKIIDETTNAYEEQKSD